MVSDALEKYNIYNDADNPEMVRDIKASAATVYAGTHLSQNSFRFPHLTMMIGSVETVGFACYKRLSEDRQFCSRPPAPCSYSLCS